MDEIREILQVIAQSTAAAASAAEAAKKAVEKRKQLRRIGQSWLQSPILLIASHKKKRSKRSESGHGQLRSA